MKQFIVLAAVIPILLLFIIQLSHEQILHGDLTAIQEIVYTAKQEARQEGRFTPELCSRMKRDIGEQLGIGTEGIAVEVTGETRYREDSFDKRSLIEYRIEVPIEKIMAGNRMLGISDKQNRGSYVVQGKVASERLRPR